MLAALLGAVTQAASREVVLDLLILGWLLFGVGLVCAQAIGIPAIPPRPVGLPVHGRWRAFKSPASRVPSHRTHAYGQTFAIDLVYEPRGAVRPRGFRRPHEFPGFGKEIVAPADGRVVTVRDRGRDHRSRSSADLVRLMRVEGRLREALGGGRLVAGNTIVLDLGGGVFASFSHLKRSSACVDPGEQVRRGEVLALCGNSGNSSQPHLHFQLMDHPRQSIAAGLPFVFTDTDHPEGWVPHTGEIVESAGDELPAAPSARSA